MRDGRYGRYGKAAAMVAAVLVAGCGGPTDAIGDAGEGDAADASTLRVVMLGGENETLDYGTAQSYFPWTVIGNACDSLVIARDGELTNALAESITPNADASEWTITIRPDATFHDGAPVTADDVTASIAYFAASPGFAEYYSSVDVDGLHAVDDLAAVVPLTEPRADFVDTVLGAASVVFADGDGGAEQPSCSGPFELERFDPDTGAVLTRNDDHWGPPPEVERLEIRKVADETARVNALVSDEADYAHDISASGASAVADTDGLRVSSGGVANANALYVVLNARVAPFDDPDVRRAVMQAVDREQLVALLLGEHGRPGNDLFGMGLDGYDEALPQRERDLDEAREVLEAAGVDALSITTAELTPGLTDSAELLAGQLAEVGVELTVEEFDPGAFFSDLERLHSSQLVTMYALNRSPVATLPQLFGEGNPYAFGGWYPDELATLVERMRTTVDDEARREVVDEIQALQWEEGPYLVWGYREQISGARADLDGVSLNLGIPLFAGASIP